ncbi:hypothetical protein BJ138DRAFT_444817 [Hygrophoropsis aurantiaca]|uniref:Uncharacterized protein n=1 Tax=Hygrophoropsis aurantiaca TaxID=72124 RepID=A0ACB8A321_9AGAM|nr:hypothetical protein BJ138DRAFT_444817 [Hygrophoropsis aurantiaca]
MLWSAVRSCGMLGFLFRVGITGTGPTPRRKCSRTDVRLEEVWVGSVTQRGGVIVVVVVCRSHYVACFVFVLCVCSCPHRHYSLLVTSCHRAIAHPSRAAITRPSRASIAIRPSRIYTAYTARRSVCR